MTWWVGKWCRKLKRYELMAQETEKQIYCAGCGEDIALFRVKRILSDDNSNGVREVRSLWYHLFNEELAKRGLEEQAHDLVTGDTTGKCVGDALTLLSNAVQIMAYWVLLERHSASHQSLPSTPTPKRLAVANDSNAEYPDIVVKLQC